VRPCLSLTRRTGERPIDRIWHFCEKFVTASNYAIYLCNLSIREIGIDVAAHLLPGARAAKISSLATTYMPKQSAGVLLHRNTGGHLEVFLVHPGGPFWAKKDDGAWSIPKGEFAEGENPLAAAKREFQEETGSPVDGNFEKLAPIKQPGGKTVYAWAIEGSGKNASFPEVDRGAWFDLCLAKTKILKGQVGFLEQLERVLSKTG
jgi:predicted NUDIX family NTP pyrophosphohydrolase